MEMPKRMTLQEAIAVLRIDRQTMYKRMAVGAIEAKRDGRRIFFLEDEVARYAREGWTK
jgi:predicted site-specific integrase-resolvase